MSPETPNPRRRRRIAGERQGRAGTPPEHQEPAAPAGALPVPEDATKREKTDASASRGDRPSGRERGPAPVRRPVPAWLLAVLGVVAAALVVVATVGVADGMGIRDYQELQEQQEVEQARRTAPAAADRAAAAILAYDYRTLEGDRDAAARFMTEEYKAKYEKTFGLVLENAPKLEAVVTAEVKASGVVHADPDRVNVLLFVNQRTVSTANNGEPQLALNRVVFAMEEQGGTWLVDGITAY